MIGDAAKGEKVPNSVTDYSNFFRLEMKLVENVCLCVRSVDFFLSFFSHHTCQLAVLELPFMSPKVKIAILLQ